MSRPALLPLFLILLLGLPSRPGCAADAELVPLPPPATAGGLPLREALAVRRTVREFRPDAVGPQALSDLLWAAFGVNRAETGHRTAPSAKNAQEIDIYVARADGVFVYEAGPHRLRRVAGEDVRGLTSGQEFARVAPVTLIYVAELSRMKDTSAADARLYAAFDAGCICQNVYLACAAAGLGTVVHDLERPPLARALALREGQHIVMAQAVGHPR